MAHRSINFQEGIHMKPIEIIAQIIGIFAMLFNILSYQCKRQKAVIAMQLFGGLLFAVNFLMLGALVGGILNIIAVLRAILFLSHLVCFGVFSYSA